MPCDLHTHSIYSDGSYTPAELINEAKRLGLIIALTDHNTAAGLAEFMAEAKAANVTAVAGTELSTDCRGVELHLLGLFIPPEHYGTIDELTAHYTELKEKSNIELVKRLCDAGYVIDYAEVKKRNATGNVNRAHIASELKDKGYVKSVAEAFDTLLYEGGGFYEPAEKLDFFEAVRFLRKVNALPVLAHPLKDIDEGALRALLPEAIKAGLVGIEVRHSSYSKREESVCDRIADEFALLKSGGSDFHGTAKPDVMLGLGKGNTCVPSVYYTELLKNVGSSGVKVNMLSFEFLDKMQFSALAPNLFDILYGNMSVIAPSKNTRAEDERTWYEAVSGGLARDARQIVLIKDGELTVGFFQYYVNSRTFMMEEVQLLSEYHGRGVLRELYRFLMPYIPSEIPSVEAFADLRNARSMDILLKMGLMPVSEESGLCRFCGSLDGLRKWIKKKN